MMRQKYDTESSFDLSYREYENDPNLNKFLASIYTDTQMYCIRHLCRDPDIISDFLLNFFERRLAGLILEFRRRNHPSFPGFFLLCLRNEFANFMRGHRRRFVPTVSLDLYANDAVGEALIYHCESDRPANRSSNCIPQPHGEMDLWEAIEEALSHLDGIDPILFKMYHNIPLNLYELRRLIELHGIEKTSRIVRFLEQRRNYRSERLEVVKRRMDRYVARRLRGEYPAGERKRETYLQAFQNRYWIHSIQGLAALLGISKQLASFRLRRTTRYLRETLTEYRPYLRAEEAG